MSKLNTSQILQTAKADSTNAPSGILQRKCACGTHTIAGDKCDECKNKQGVLQRKSSNNSEQLEVPPIVNEVLQSSGQPLDAGTRAFIEPRFGRDFSSVRIHTDSKAAQSAQSVKALAYTVGRNIVFGNGMYAPETMKGKRLLAHELTHVVQQGFRNTLVQYKLVIGNASDAAEKEAEQSTNSVMSGQGPETISTVGTDKAVIQRAETDTSAGCTSLDDAKTDVNARVNQAMDNARTTIGKTGMDVIKGLFSELGENKATGRTGIEVWAQLLGTSKVQLPRQKETKYADVGYRLWKQPLFPILNPTMRINNICVGSDKLGHFLQQGHEYLEVKQKPGATTDDAETFGAGTEAGGFGLTSTGVFSNADLEANRQGLRFYEAIIANPSLKLDIAQYINDRWNEENNPSHYQEDVGQTVWRNLLSGSWNAAFTSNSASKSFKAIANLTVADDKTTLTGKFGYATDDGSVINGDIINGRVSHEKNNLKAVTGVKINFDWQSGIGVGKGQWASKKENDLEGKSGTGASSDNGGTWLLTKSRAPLAIPLSQASQASKCQKDCEDEFNRCTKLSTAGGIVCIGRRSSCLMSCSSGKK